MNQANQNPRETTNFWTSWKAVPAILGLVSLVIYLALEHRAHTIGFAPYLLFLACPLMHFFMHRGHGAHGVPK